MIKYNLAISLDKTHIIYGIEGQMHANKQNQIYLPDYVDSVLSVTISDHLSEFKIPFVFSISTKNLILQLPTWANGSTMNYSGKSALIEYYSVSKTRESKINQIIE